MSKERLQVITRHLTSAKMAANPITTHVLDTSRGLPAKNVAIELFEFINGKWISLVGGKTDDNGRCNELRLSKPLEKGKFKLVFDTGSYFRENSQATFYPCIEVVFEVTSPNEHYHVPLLLSPFGYSTYRGS